MCPSSVRPLLAAVLVVAVLVGCGHGGAASPPGDGDKVTAVDIRPLADDVDEAAFGADPIPESPAAGDAGTVTVDGTTYAIDETRTCDPDAADLDAIERELALWGLGSSDDDRVQIQVAIEEQAGVLTHRVSWSGPEGKYDGSVSDAGNGWRALDSDASPSLGSAGPPITVDRYRGVSGELRTPSATGGTDRVDITFDLVVPADHSACR